MATEAPKWLFREDANYNKNIKVSGFFFWKLQFCIIYIL